MKNNLNSYLIEIGRYSVNYKYDEVLIIKYIDYFISCFESEISAYKAMEFLWFEISEEERKEYDKEYDLN
jgi:hypothetical protein